MFQNSQPNLDMSSDYSFIFFEKLNFVTNFEKWTEFLKNNSQMAIFQYKTACEWNFVNEICEMKFWVKIDILGKNWNFWVKNEILG